MKNCSDTIEKKASTHAYRTQHSVVTADGWKTARCLDAFCKRNWEAAPSPAKEDESK